MLLLLATSHRYTAIPSHSTSATTEGYSRFCCCAVWWPQACCAFRGEQRAQERGRTCPRGGATSLPEIKLWNSKADTSSAKTRKSWAGSSFGDGWHEGHSPWETHQWCNEKHIWDLHELGLGKQFLNQGPACCLWSKSNLHVWAETPSTVPAWAQPPSSFSISQACQNLGEGFCLSENRGKKPFPFSLASHHPRMREGWQHAGQKKKGDGRWRNGGK